LQASFVDNRIGITHPDISIKREAAGNTGFGGSTRTLISDIVKPGAVPEMSKPNVVFLHAHNTGRYIQPYGHAIPTPNLQRLAERGVIFRQAFAAAPTCSPSRASFMTGMYPHCCGMLGLAHRGFSLPDYGSHLANFLKTAGYTTVLSGVEHTAPDLTMVGYDKILSFQKIEFSDARKPKDPAETAAEYLRSTPEEPFFLSVGLTETHRPFPKADPGKHPFEDPRYCRAPQPLPDVPETRADMADFKAAARLMDEKFGLVLDALEEGGLASRTYVFCFCDHGAQFPLNICNLTDHGTGVFFLVRGPQHFRGGMAVDIMVSLIDLFPTVCELADIQIPEWVQGRSLVPLVRREVAELHDVLFAEINYHAAYEAARCVRTPRYKYIRRYDNREQLVLPNVDDTPSKEYMLASGWADCRREQEMLYDLLFDPNEIDNLVDRPACQSIRGELEKRLDAWMEQTGDPLLDGAVPAPVGSYLNNPDGRSPEEPTHRVP
jgi:N-sulfoglucosamine sulfohydrolase